MNEFNIDEEQTWLVTGGAGFIGSNICRKLISLKTRVRVFDNFSTGRESNLADLAGKIEMIRGDLAEPEQVREAVKGVDYILHQGALPSVPRSIANPEATHRANITGTMNLLLAARDESVKRVVFASSSSVYGDTEVLPKVETMIPNPLSPYALSKLAGEYYCRVFHRIYGLETVCLRYFNVFGPYQDPGSQYAAVIPRFITRIMEGKPPVIFGDGEQSRDFTCIDNVVDANLRAAEAEDAPGEVINIACGSRITVNRMAELMGEILESPLKPLYDHSRPGDVKHSLAHIGKAERILGYKPKISLEEGLKKTIEWYKKEES